MRRWAHPAPRRKSCSASNRSAASAPTHPHGGRPHMFRGSRLHCFILTPFAWTCRRGAIADTSAKTVQTVAPPQLISLARRVQTESSNQAFKGSKAIYRNRMSETIHSCEVRDIPAGPAGVYAGTRASRRVEVHSSRCLAPPCPGRRWKRD